MNANNLGGIIYKERLTQARLLRGMNRQELAKQLGVSRQAVSQYESGMCKPSPEILFRYQTLLGIPHNFFVNSPLPESDTALNYRRLKRSSEVEKGIAKTRIEFMAQIFHYLKNYVNFPEVSLPFYSHEETYYSEGDIEAIATNVREELRLGESPIPDMMLVAENCGCIVCRYNNTETKEGEVDGCSKIFPLEDDKRPFITLMERGCSSACRERFSMAHELGHLILHSWANEEYVKDKENYDRMEREANAFAGAFLLPMEAFARELRASYGFDTFVLLKARWKTSIAAMIYRAKEIGLIGEFQSRYMFKQLSMKGMKRSEPLDGDIQHEEPNTLKSAADLLFENEIVSPNEMLDKLALPSKEVNEILGFSEERPLFRMGEIIRIYPQLS